MNQVLEGFLDKNSRRAKEYLEIIEEMLSDGRYDYAEHTLTDIYDFIEANDYITDGQIQAIENIKEKPSEHYGR